MEFASQTVRHAAELFRTVGFGQAREALMGLLLTRPETPERTEATALLLRINIERDETETMEEMTSLVCELRRQATKHGLKAALYHLGIVSLLADDADGAELCFSQVDDAYGAYGMAAVLHKRRESEAALAMLRGLQENLDDVELKCLICLLESNCLKGLGRVDEAVEACQAAQSLLPLAKTYYLKHWVFLGLATVHARRNETDRAVTLLEALLSITHPVDFRRLHRLATDELARLTSKVEALLDPISGDLFCGRGYLSLRRKPVLISLLATLMRAWPNTVSKEELYRRVWGGEYHPLRHDGLIYAHIQRMRQHLSTDKSLKDFVLTAPEGYRLNADIRVTLKEDNYDPRATHHGSVSRNDSSTVSR